MYDKLPFFGIKVHATSIGPVTQIPIGIMGTMAQMIFWDVRDKTKRGQLVAPAPVGFRAALFRLRRKLSSYCPRLCRRPIAHRV
jgi:hypothetical protein